MFIQILRIQLHQQIEYLLEILIENMKKGTKRTYALYKFGKIKFCFIYDFIIIIFMLIQFHLHIHIYHMFEKLENLINNMKRIKMIIKSTCKEAHEEKK